MGRGAFVGAYAAGTSLTPTWDPERDAALLAGLHGLDGVRGLELPWRSALHPHDEAWLLGQLRDDWDVVITEIQTTGPRAIADPAFGIASEDAGGRNAALGVLADLRSDALRLHDHLGRAAVTAVELHTQPRALTGAESSAEALQESLAEVLDWGWDDTLLLVEHSDARSPANPHPGKGYLTLEAEIAAVAALQDARVGIEVNWGRSAIETRSSAGVVEHLTAAREAGVLRGLFFSGVMPVAGPYGDAWQDAHPPFAPGGLITAGADGSLLDEAAAHAALAAAGDVEILGLKTSWRPLGDDPSTVLRSFADQIGLLTATTSTLPPA